MRASPGGGSIRDFVAARDWLNNSTLSAEMKDRLLKDHAH